MFLNLPAPAAEALERLNRAGFEAYFAGGCVRDACLGLEPHDFDITTSALPDETMAVFAGERLIGTGLQHGTVTVLLQGMPLEITTYRVDVGYSDGRHPDAVRFTRSLREDAARRDFTVNAMAWHPKEGLKDFFGGQQDLQQKRIRCVGSPGLRFEEDALRILRALRFSSTLGFALEEETARAACDGRHLLSRISAERIREELTKLVCGRDMRRVVLRYTDILKTDNVLPELGPMQHFDQHNIHHCYDVLEHCAAAAEAVPPDPLLRWAALLHDAGKPACFTLDETGTGHFYGHAELSEQLADRALLRLKFDSRSRERIVRLVREHDRIIPDNARGVRRALARLGEADFFLLMDLKRADNYAQAPAYRDRQKYIDRLEELAHQLLSEQQCLSLSGLAVSGSDLIAVGMNPGPALGRRLQALLDAVLDEQVPNERAALLNWSEMLNHKEEET